MEQLFYRDTLSDVTKHYSDLIEDLQNETNYCRYCKTSSFYEVFRQIVLSLLIGEEIVLLDTDFTDEEITSLIGDISLLTTSRKNVHLSEKLTVDNLLTHIQEYKADWKITLFTSGTTGLPKKVSHSFSSITRFVRNSERHTNDIWGFAYNPTHMAGLQVFFQAFLNMNPMIRLFGLGKEEILSLVENYEISNISATPTFYRLLLPADKQYPTVKRITSGGEKFDDKIQECLNQIFPMAKITNVYASTEAGTLFASKGNSFTVKEEMLKYIKIVNNELFIHRSLMGESESLRLDDDWYATGDLIIILSEKPYVFKFISRKNEMINVGGYKVNPTEVEEAIRKYEGVQDVFVFAKKNRILGNVICCEIVSSIPNLKELDIRLFLKEILQEFKIPRLMSFVSKLDTTRTGKVLRNR